MGCLLNTGNGRTKPPFEVGFLARKRRLQSCYFGCVDWLMGIKHKLLLKALAPCHERRDQGWPKALDRLKTVLLNIGCRLNPERCKHRLAPRADFRDFCGADLKP